tara:strand:+ start:145 stop:381 length:237 start_codon:yes stop_codon:yes gene_type:complete
MNENIKRDRRERFKSLASARVNKALQNLKLIGNLSNKQHYEYDELDVKKIFNVLEIELKTAKQKFQKPNMKNNKFILE